MEKQYLVITKYENTSDLVQVVEEKELRFHASLKPQRIFEWNAEKVIAVLKEVEVKVVEKNNEQSG